MLATMQIPGQLEPLMGRSQVRVPWREWVNPTTDFDLKTTGSKQKSPLRQKNHRFHAINSSTSHHPLALSYVAISSHVMLEKDKINKKSGSMPLNL